MYRLYISEKTKPPTASRTVNGDPMAPADPPDSHPIAAPINEPMAPITILSGDGSAIPSPPVVSATYTLGACGFAMVPSACTPQRSEDRYRLPNISEGLSEAKPSGSLPATSARAVRGCCGWCSFGEAKLSGSAERGWLQVPQHQRGLERGEAERITPRNISEGGERLFSVFSFERGEAERISVARMVTGWQRFVWA